MTHPETSQAETFRVWAPAAESVSLVVGAADARPELMRAGADGWWVSDRQQTPGTDYGFVVTGADGETTGPLPDPRSTWQPHGVHGLSRVHRVDPERWTDTGWTGRPLAGGVVYEMHVGTFSDKGTFAGAIAHLDELVELGVTMVELMPVNAFDGDHGWGYDGVLWFAVHQPYGGPDGLQDFVDACHARGLAVCLDVVYNHLGPSGNYLGQYGPYVVAGGSPWGDGINLDREGADEVRAYITDNVARWFSEFHVDALRLDAVHALHDTSALHLLEDLAARTDALAAHLGRPLSLVAESDLNDARLVTSREAGGYGLTAQWDDDVHHAIHAAVSGERQGYYADFGSLDALATVLTGAFFHAGTYSSFRGRRHGRPVDRAHLPGSRFVAYTLTHDQVGNRATGDRPSMNLTPAQQIAKAALVLCSPFTPMLFQGEEWGAGTPFPFFTSFDDPDLAEAVRTGRRAEFAAMGWDADAIPDPQDPATFTGATLDRAEIAAEPHSTIRRAYRELLALRRSCAELTDPDLAAVRVDTGTEAPDDHWLAVHRGDVTLVVNLGTLDCRMPVGGTALFTHEARVDAEHTECAPYGVAVVRCRLR